VWHIRTGDLGCRCPGAASPPAGAHHLPLAPRTTWPLALQGIDAELLGSSPGRQALARAAGRAMAQGRIFLTRDYGLAQRRDGGAVFLLHSDEPVVQLGEVAAHFRIRWAACAAAALGPAGTHARGLWSPGSPADARACL
jgi:hypothetical protein